MPAPCAPSLVVEPWGRLKRLVGMQRSLHWPALDYGALGLAAILPVAFDVVTGGLGGTPRDVESRLDAPVPPVRDLAWERPAVAGLTAA